MPLVEMIEIPVGSQTVQVSRVGERYFLATRQDDEYEEEELSLDDRKVIARFLNVPIIEVPKPVAYRSGGIANHNYGDPEIREAAIGK